MKRDLVREILAKTGIREDSLRTTLSRIKRRHNLKSTEQAACYYILTHNVNINVSSVIDDVTRNAVYSQRRARLPAPGHSNIPQARGSKPGLPKIRWLGPHYYALADRLPDFYGRLFLFENALRIKVNSVMAKADPNWWETCIKRDLRATYDYAEKRKAEQQSLAMLGQGKQLDPYERITIGQLEEIISKYNHLFVPAVFPNLHFFTGHMVIVKSVRHAIAHMSPAVTARDIRNASSDMDILLQHLSTL